MASDSRCVRYGDADSYSKGNVEIPEVLSVIIVNRHSEIEMGPAEGGRSTWVSEALSTREEEEDLALRPGGYT